MRLSKSELVWERKWERLLHREIRSGLQSHQHVLTGLPYTNIQELISLKRADLLTHGRIRLRRLLTMGWDVYQKLDQFTGQMMPLIRSQLQIKLKPDPVYLNKTQGTKDMDTWKEPNMKLNTKDYILKNIGNQTVDIHFIS